MALRSEDDFLALIDRHFPRLHPHVVLGRGDDAAVLACPRELVLSADLFLEDAHFRMRYFTPWDIGHKALAVNLSDLAAMGATPLGFCLVLTAPPGLGQEFWEGLFEGMACLAREHDTPLVGGDLNRGDKLALSVTVWGRAPEGGRFLTRSGARTGDALFVVGEVGLARAGLLCLEERGRVAASGSPAAAKAHLRPEPLLAQGVLLAAEPGVRCGMDVSDGLARDLPRLLGPHHGADLELDESWLHPEVLAFCRKRSLSAAQFAVLGGEDYALTGAADPSVLPALEARLPGLRRIGAVTDSPGLRLHGESLAGKGFDHFAT